MVEDHLPTPTPAPAARAHLSVGQKLAAMLALPLLANGALLAVIFAALGGDQSDVARASAALDHAARGRDLHLAALQHREAVRQLLASTGGERDLHAAGHRLARAAQEYQQAAAQAGAGSASDTRRCLDATGRAASLAAEALAGTGARPAIRARYEDAFGREVLPALEDAVRAEAGDARAAMAAAQVQGRRRLVVGTVAALLSVLLALGPALLFARQLSRSVGELRAAAGRIGTGDLSVPVPTGGELEDLAASMNQMAAELRSSRDRETLVAAAEARIQALEEGRAELEARVDDRTRALARANTDLAENLHQLAEAQQRLLASERMAAIGQLAAAVAHEINNPIASVASNLRYLSDEVRTIAGELRADGRPIDVAREAELASALVDAREASQRVARIVHDLGTIARGESEPLAHVDLREAVEAAINVAQAGMKAHARFERNLDEVPAVSATHSRLGQVFLPILLQAGRALAARGPSARGTIRVATWTDPERGAVAEIRDDGLGLSAEAVAHLFDPFGRLQPAGPAAGLGLAVAHGIVTALGGSIEVRSAPESGTVVRVVLPEASLSTPAVHSMPRTSARSPAAANG